MLVDLDAVSYSVASASLKEGNSMNRCIGLILAVAMMALASGGEITNIRSDRSFGVSATAGGASLIGVSLDYFIIPEVDIDLCLGLGFSGGLRFHPLGGKNSIKMSPYIGAQMGVFPETSVDIFGSVDSDALEYSFYYPLGLHYMANSGFSIMAEAAFLRGVDNAWDEDFRVLFGALRIGWRF